MVDVVAILVKPTSSDTGTMACTAERLNLTMRVVSFCKSHHSGRITLFRSKEDGYYADKVTLKE